VKLPHAQVEQIHLYVDLRAQAEISALARKLDSPPDSSSRLHFLLPRHKTSVWERVREQAELLLEKHLSGT
jgi:hypothetical protein